MDPDCASIPQSLKPWPLGLQSVVAESYRDPAAVCSAYRQWVPVSDFRSLVPHAFCWHQAGHLLVNETWVSACSGTRHSVAMEECPQVYLVACLHGSFTVEMPQGVAHGVAGSAVLLPIGHRQAVCHQSAVATGMQPALIADVAAMMAGQERGSMPGLARTTTFTPMAFTAGPQASAIHGLLRYIDTCHAAGPTIAAHLGLDDVLHRLVAGLLLPSLLEAEPHAAERGREREGRNAFDDLIAYIRANLDQPLRLSDLEARSFYSRRALQYAFREQLGMTPRQWIREQRLARAREQLESSPARALSIRAVALACGYRTVGQFSTDFKRRFAITPSQVQRLPLT